TGDFLALVEATEPEQITLVPDDPEQPTSDHGWDFIANREMLKAIVTRLKKTGARISLFSDPDVSEEQIAAAKATGADRIELYTGPYGACYDDEKKAAAALARLGKAADMAHAAGLGVNAGHDLTVANLPALARRIPYLAEVSIGHGLTAYALAYGMAETVRRFLDALSAWAAWRAAQTCIPPEKLLSLPRLRDSRLQAGAQENMADEQQPEELEQPPNPLEPHEAQHEGAEPSSLPLMVLGALGIVFGDIGTSPIYAMREALLNAATPAGVAPVDVFGILS